MELIKHHSYCIFLWKFIECSFNSLINLTLRGMTRCGNPKFEIKSRVGMETLAKITLNESRRMKKNVQRRYTSKKCVSHFHFWGFKVFSLDFFHQPFFSKSCSGRRSYWLTKRCSSERTCPHKLLSYFLHSKPTHRRTLHAEMKAR